jgi:hypothetical protein
VGQTLPASLWLNLANTDDIGTHFDVLVEALDQTGVVFATGMLDRFRPVRVASAAESITLTASRTVGFNPSDPFKLRVNIRIDEGPCHTSGRLQVQFDAVTRSSTLVVNFGSGNRTYYLHDNPQETNGVMDTTDNTGDTTVNMITKLASKNGGNPWVQMGIWTGTVGSTPLALRGAPNLGVPANRFTPKMLQPLLDVRAWYLLAINSPAEFDRQAPHAPVPEDESPETLRPDLLDQVFAQTSLALRPLLVRSLPFQLLELSDPDIAELDWVAVVHQDEG